MARWQGAVVGVIGALSTDRLQRLTTVKVEEPRTLAEDETRDSRRSRGPTAAVVRSISAAGIDATIAGECQ